MWNIQLSRAVPLLCSSLVSLVAGCGGDGDGGGPVDNREKGPDITQGVVGTVFFEKRPIIQGVAPEGTLGGKDRVQLVPATHVSVEIVEENGGSIRVISSTVTDGEGRYGIGGVFPDGFRVQASPESPQSNDPSLPVSVQDLAGNRYAVASAPQPPVNEGDRVIVDVVGTVEDPLRVAGAFNIVDAIQRGASWWTGVTGISPDPVVVRWESGEKPGTFYDPSTNRISVEGGLAGLVDSSDTDEFDDTVICHEYFHFLIANHGHSSSPGGPHAITQELLPNLAFEEGLADWFGVVANSTRLYQDTAGSEDGVATCAVCDDLEDSGIRVVNGIGSERSVYEILWDLTDGLPGMPADQDGDGVAIPVSELTGALLELDEDADYTYLLTHLDQLVARRTLALSQVQSLLASPVDHDITYPPVDRPDPSNGFLNGRDIFPVTITVGDALQGFVDGSGSNEERGFDSIRYYRLELARSRALTITLNIDGTGRVPNDLDLWLLRVDNSVVAVSDASASPTEVIGPRFLSPGVYIVAVFPFFTSQGSTRPNSGTYTLEVN